MLILSFHHRTSLRRRSLTLALLILAALPVWAQDTMPSESLPVLAADGPRLLNGNSGSGLRPEPGVASSTPMPDPTSDSSAPSVPPTKVSSTQNTSAASPGPSSNAMVNLINLLVGQKVITQDAGDKLIRQAEQEADTARAQTASTQATVERALTVQASAPPPAPTPAPASDDEVQVAYVPDVVKNQIRDEVTESVLKQTRDEKFASKSDIPDWVKRFRVNGDIRVRYEGDFYPSGNAIGNFTNFNAINTSASGFNVNTLSPNFTPLPQNNVDQDRNRFRLRARIGAEVDLTHGFTVGMRVGTGADNSPVTGNQTLGLANNGQGGNFAKYAIWIDRAFLRYELDSQPDQNLALTIGRFDNPFFHTSMIWSDDLGFDGAVVQGKYKMTEGVTPFFVAGGFPIFNTDYNFSSTQSAKFQSEDKYLLAGQVGTNWAINKDFNAKVAAAYYYFQNVEGKVSSPIPFAVPSAVGDTDDSRPSFAQNGNTYIALRDFEDSNPADTTANEYYGLATPFHEFALTSQLDYSGFDPFHLWLTGEFVKNLAFDRNNIINNGAPFAPGPQNNTLNAADPNSFVGGDTGWIVKLNMGKVALQEFGDWNVGVSYRYVESDATVDGFTESDFGGGMAGTNLKGYTLGGNVAFSPQVWAGLRWMSADAVAGPTYKNDLIQFDINAKF